MPRSSIKSPRYRPLNRPGMRVPPPWPPGSPDAENKALQTRVLIRQYDAPRGPQGEISAGESLCGASEGMLTLMVHSPVNGNGKRMSGNRVSHKNLPHRSAYVTLFCPLLKKWGRKGARLFRPAFFHFKAISTQGTGSCLSGGCWPGALNTPVVPQDAGSPRDDGQPFKQGHLYRTDTVVDVGDHTVIPMKSHRYIISTGGLA